MAEPAAAPASSLASAVEAVPASAPTGDADAKAKRARIAKAKADAAAKHGTSPARKAFDPVREAKKALAERKKLRLAASDGETVEDTQEDFDPEEGRSDATDAISPERPEKPAASSGAKADAKAKDAKPEDGKEPSWAAKLKQDHEQAKQRIAHHEEREATWGKVIDEIKGHVAERDVHIADLTDDVTLYKDIANQLVSFLNKVAPGKFVKESLDLLLAKHENKKLERRMKDGQAKLGNITKAQQTEQVRAQVRSTLDGLRKQYPELDYTKNPAAKAFFQRFVQRGIPIEEITADEIREFVSSQRFAASSRAKAATTRVEPEPAGDEPEPSVRGAQVGTRNRNARPGNAPITNAAARKLLRDFRAAKGARG